MRRRQLLMGIILLSVGGMSGFWFGGRDQEIGATRRPETGGSVEAKPVTESVGHDHANHEPKVDWCSEHWFPESECTKCKPELAAGFRSQGNWCDVHGYPESHCRKCNPRLTFPQEPQQSRDSTAETPAHVSVFFPPNDKACTPEQALIQFTSVETPARIGLRTESVLPAEAGSAIEAPAELVFDDTRTVAITTSLSATIVQWRVEPGDSLSHGRVIAELESSEMAQLKASYLEAVADWNLAETQLKRAVDLLKGDLISQAEYQDAEARSRTSQSRMEGLIGRLWSAGLRDDDLAELRSNRQITPRWFLRTAKAGTLLERRASLGELLAAGSTIALIGEPTALWIEAHIREQDMPKFQKEMTVDFAIDGDEISHTTGRILWVAQYLDPRTITGLIRARITSDPSKLRANMFGRIRLRTPLTASATLVSKDAVQWEGCCHVVFIQEAIDRYRPRKVSIDRGDRRHYLVTSGLTPGELVVTDGSFLLKSELKKESLGVGCAGE